jgi:hypothetical protein
MGDARVCPEVILLLDPVEVGDGRPARRPRAGAWALQSHADPLVRRASSDDVRVHLLPLLVIQGDRNGGVLPVMHPESTR